QPRRFFLVERQREGLHHPLAADQARQRHGDVANARHVRGRDADRHHGTLVVQDDVGNAGQGAADAVVGGALAGDDGIGGAAYLGVDVLPDLGAVRDAAEAGELLQRHAGDRGERPGEDLRIAVFTDDVRVDVVWVDAAMPAEQAAEAGRVQGR